MTDVKATGVDSAHRALRELRRYVPDSLGPMRFDMSAAPGYILVKDTGDWFTSHMANLPAMLCTQASKALTELVRYRPNGCGTMNVETLEDTGYYAAEDVSRWFSVHFCEPGGGTKPITGHVPQQYASVAAITFALRTDCPMEFLECWLKGEFEEIRREWPEAPEDIYVGADPIHPQTRAMAATVEPMTVAEIERMWCANCTGPIDDDTRRFASLLEQQIIGRLTGKSGSP